MNPAPLSCRPWDIGEGRPVASAACLDAGLVARTPADMYAGRQAAIPDRRAARLKRETLARRKRENLRVA